MSIIYLRADGPIEQLPLVLTFPDAREMHRFNYEVIELYKMTAQQLLDIDRIGWQPLLLFTEGGKTPTMIEVLIERLRATKQVNLLAMTYQFEGMAFKTEPERLWFRGRFSMLQDILKESWVYQEIGEEFFERGIGQGIERGREQERREEMKSKHLMAVGALTLTTITTLYLINRYKTWKQQELARIRSESHIIETALGPVEYSTIGQGPAVLVAHGSPGGYDQGMAFSKLVDSSKLTFIAVSRPGYLRTPLSTGKTPEEQAHLYAALLDVLDIRQAAIIGMSGGGPSALQFALQHRDRCSGLVMVCALAQRYSEKDVGESLPPVRRFARQFADRMLLFDPALFLMEALTRWYPKMVALGDVFRTIAIHRLRKIGYDNDMQQFAALTAYPLENITVPTLVLHGTSDYTVSFAEAVFVASKVPHAKLVAVEGGDHTFYVTHKEQVVPRLRAFLEVL